MCSSKCSFSQLACRMPQAAICARSASVREAQSLVRISSGAKRREHLQASSARSRWAMAARHCSGPACGARLSSTRPALAVSEASRYSACGDNASGSMASTMAITLPMRYQRSSGSSRSTSKNSSTSKMPLGSTTTRSKPRMAMAMSLVRMRRWWVSQSHPPLMVSRSHRSPSRSCTNMASTFTAPKSFSRMQTLCPCSTRYRTYRRRKVVLPAPRNPVIRSTCTIFSKHLPCRFSFHPSIPQRPAKHQR